MELMVKQEYDSFTQQEEEHNKWWEIAFRSKKICNTCGQLLPLDHFDVQKVAPDGRKYICKKCNLEKYVRPNKEKYAERAKKWQRNNPEKTKKARKIQSQKPQSKLRKSLANRVKRLLNSKTEHFNELVGCTPKELAIYLENLFQPGMSWDRKDEIHIDHIIPCRAFDLTRKEERLRCFHYTNLQPLWAKDNIQKSDRLPSGENARKTIRIT